MRGIGGSRAVHRQENLPGAEQTSPERTGRRIMAEITYIEGIRQALWEEMERDERVILLGEDIGQYGGAF